MKKGVTLKDVARKAGVSAMSVSKAVNNKPGLSTATRQRILDIAKELNYSPNTVALSLRTLKTRTLGVVMSDTSVLNTAHVLSGIEYAAARAGYNIIIANTDTNAAVEKRSVETLVNKQIDGLILVAPVCSSLTDIEWLLEFRLPVVMLMRSSGNPQVDTVVNNNQSGARQLTRHLIEVGCQDFAVLPLSRTSQNGQERLQGIRDELAAHQLALNNQLVLFSQPYVQDGFENTRKLLAKGIRFDALICGCDLIAIGAIEALRSAGLSVPNHVRVTGYDDIDLADYLAVPLTTMRQPFREIGARGTELLLKRIKNPDEKPQQLILESTLMIRRSG